MGLAPILVERIYETVREINQQGTTILLVEQNANYALEVSAARVRARDRHGGPHRRVGQASREPRGPAGLPGGCVVDPVIALLGAKALWLTYAWLASAIVASYLSDRKGYGEKPGLASGLLLAVAGVVVWLLVPSKPDSRWRLQGPFGKGKEGKTVAQMRAELDQSEKTQPPPS